MVAGAAESGGEVGGTGGVLVTQGHRVGPGEDCGFIVSALGRHWRVLAGEPQDCVYI